MAALADGASKSVLAEAPSREKYLEDTKCHAQPKIHATRRVTTAVIKTMYRKLISPSSPRSLVSALLLAGTACPWETLVVETLEDDVGNADVGDGDDRINDDAVIPRYENSARRFAAGEPPRSDIARVRYVENSRASDSPGFAAMRASSAPRLGA